MYRLGIMGGTFDPIHYGHMVAAEMARTEFALAKVLFIPAGDPPHKAGQTISPGYVRYDMVKQAVSDNPFFEVSPLEIDRVGPSYTVDTLRQVHINLQDSELYFITGSDALREIFDWRETMEMLSLAHFIGASRPGFETDEFLRQVESEHPEVRGRIHVLEVPALAISSTDIRARVAGGRSIRYLLPEQVRLYIEEAGLYKPGSQNSGVRS